MQNKELEYIYTYINTRRRSWSHVTIYKVSRKSLRSCQHSTNTRRSSIYFSLTSNLNSSYSSLVILRTNQILELGTKLYFALSGCRLRKLSSCVARFEQQILNRIDDVSIVPFENIYDLIELLSVAWLCYSWNSQVLPGGGNIWRDNALNLQGILEGSEEMSRCPSCLLQIFGAQSTNTWCHQIFLTVNKRASCGPLLVIQGVSWSKSAFTWPPDIRRLSPEGLGGIVSSNFCDTNLVSLTWDFNVNYMHSSEAYQAV